MPHIEIPKIPKNVTHELVYLPLKIQILTE
jgi:hypothetical protein